MGSGTEQRASNVSESEHRGSEAVSAGTLGGATVRLAAVMKRKGKSGLVFNELHHRQHRWRVRERVSGRDRKRAIWAVMTRHTAW